MGINQREKVFLVICDGLGDLPVRGKTPLQAAKTPNMNSMAKEGITGLMHTLGQGLVPGSDTAHLALFGYDPHDFYEGRGPLEALGAGMKLQRGDVALRANLATQKDGKLLDRRAGRSPQGMKELARELNGATFEDVKIIVKHTVEHRLAVVLRGKGLSSNVSDVDPEEVGNKILRCKPLDGTEEAKKTARVINKLVQKSRGLAKHSANKARVNAGLPPANIMIARGAGKYQKIQTIEDRFRIKASCIAGGALYKGVARFVGMDVPDVPGATGRTDTDLDATASAAINALKGHDLIFIHIKGTDSCGHDGNFKGKKEMVERIDAMLKTLMKEKAYIILTGDHSTPVSKRRHTSDPCPIIIWGKDVRADEVKKFDEFECMEGGLGHIQGLDVMPIILDLINKSFMYGA